MNKDNLIEKLKSLGFKEYESKVFIVLLKGIPMSASEIAKEANIIRNSIYDILKSFVSKGYCNEIETDTILNYQIIDPLIIFDKIQKDYNDNHKQRLSTLSNTFNELQTIYKKETQKNEPGDTNIQLIRGFNKHRVAKYTELFKNSHKEVLGMYQLRGIITDELNEDAVKLVKKGGVIRSIYQSSLDFKTLKNNQPLPASNDDLIKVCEMFKKNGEDVRISTVKIPNVTVFDRQNVFINIAGDKSVPKHKQADIIINNTDFSEHMKDLFNYYWQISQTIDEFKSKKQI